MLENCLALFGTLLTASLQDNVFVQLICSIQYRVVKMNADDAFYELQNPQEQIQAYVFDGNIHGLGELPILMMQ